MQKRKQRYWICDKCYVIYSRKKKDAYQCCHVCGEHMRKAIKWPNDRWLKLREKKKKKEKVLRADRTKRYSKLYNSQGYVFKVSKKLKSIWKTIEGLKQKPALIRWSNKFIEEVYNCIHADGQIGFVSVPNVIMKDMFDHGDYVRALFKEEGHRIAIKNENIEQMKLTLLHESVHYIDDCTRATRGGKRKKNKIPRDLGHDVTWHRRLFLFKKRLGVSLQYMKENLDVH